MRLACFNIPLFPLAARLRSEPELIPEAVVIVEGSGSAARVVAATRRARKEKIRPGLTLSQARAIMPKLIARGRDASCEHTAQEALLEVAESFSPRIEDGGEGVAFADITGMERHFAGKDSVDGAGELALARAAIRAADSAGLPARLGIASSKLAARVASELPRSPIIVPPCDEASFLSPLPLARLAPELRIAAALERWGIGSVGQFAQLPESEVASRLGEIGRILHRTARGIDLRPLMPRRPPPDFREGSDLEWPLVSLEPFLFIANAALDRLCQRLGVQGFACRRIEFVLGLEPDGFASRAIDLPAPTRDVKTILTLVRLDLERTPPGAPVTNFTFIAHPDRPRSAQLSLFGPAALSPDKLTTTIARLIAMLGEGRAGMPVTIDSHAPERFSIEAFDPPPPPTTRREPPRSRGILAVRILRPPLELEVTAEGGVLRSIRTPPPTDGEKRFEIRGDVRVASGPWSIEERWWTEEPVVREYWDVELTGGGVYRLFRTGPEWFVDGVYD